jgi:hypothetical protein
MFIGGDSLIPNGGQILIGRAIEQNDKVLTSLPANFRRRLFTMNS